MIACRFYYLFLFFGLLLSPFAVAEGAVRAEMTDVLADCLSLADERDACYATACEYEPGYLCAEDVLDVVVEIAGPERAMEVLHELMVSPVFAITTDGHLLAHIIGRATSRVFGSSGENFLRCPHSFNDGCYHGFFEDTLVKVDDPVAVAMRICEGMPPETTSDKEKGYCYHGAGHVFLMQASYDLDAGISACISVSEQWRDVCLSGVFMENAWPTRDWEAKSANFREDDPLYPCNTLDENLRPTCYMEHYSYLMHVYTTSFDELVAICLQAGDNAGDCLSGIGLMLQNSQRTNAVFSSFGIADRSYMEKIIFLCNQFPEEHKSSCYIPLVGALLNFDYPSMDRLSVFCGGVAEEHRGACFRRAGSYLNHLGSEEVKQSACSEIPVLYQDDCLGSGAEHGGVVISEFAESAGAAETSFEDEVGQLGHFISAAAHFFTDLFNTFLALFARPVSAQGVDDSALSGVLFSDVEQCRHQSGGRAACYASLCEYEPGYLCAERILEAVTREVAAGPEVGMRVLQELVDSPLFDLSIGDSGHSLAHVVGRATAQHIGMDGEAFLRCPTSFDYGCVHGFLEISLAESSSPAEAILEVCESLPEKPGIGRPNCYHGSGHGVMMNVSYNLDEALAICDALPDPYGCWGGVFMENNSGHHRILELYPEHNSFDEYNLLAPCNVVDEKYRTTCFRVHILYLGKVLQYDMDAVVVTCLSAGEHVEDCVFGFGWHILFEDLQDAFLPGTDMNFIEKTIYLCDKFPEQYRGICYRPAVNQVTVSYGAEQTFEFCEKVEEQYVRDCYQEIGRRLDDLILHQREKIEACAPVPERYRDDCLHGRERQEQVDPSSERDFVVSDVVVEQMRESPLSRLAVFLRNVVSSILAMFARPVSVQSGVDLQDGVRRCLPLEHGEDVCYASLCEYEPGYLCAEKIVAAVAALQGPETGIRVLKEISESPLFTLQGDLHQLAHVVGRSAARSHGDTGDVFNRCPLDFAYGCSHGFFEYTLSQVASPVLALISICDSLKSGSYDKKACYHGGGHGLMMNESYNLDRALSVCDSLPSYQSDCETGVFMENAVGFVAGRVPPEYNLFMPGENWLAPCDSIRREYRRYCYAYHHRNYLPYMYSAHSDDLIAVCLDAGEDRDLCLRGHAEALITFHNDVIFPTSFPDVALRNRVERSAYLCDHFPDQYISLCHRSVLQRLLSRSRLSSVKRYCASVQRHKEVCSEVLEEEGISVEG